MKGNIGVGVLVLLFAIGIWQQTSTIDRTSQGAALRAEVMVIRDLSEVRFTNDSLIDLHNCRVQIDGGYLAQVDELKAGDRATLPRAKFSRNLPGDEFYRRSRTMEMGCLDESNTFVEITLK